MRREDERNDTEVEIPCLWFFLPLPHPLGLPTGWTSEHALSPAQLLRAAGPTSGLASSLLIHQLDPSVQPLLRDMSELLGFAAEIMKGEALDRVDLEALDPEEVGDLSPLHAVRTIAEVAVPGATSAEEDLVWALDEAIDHVRFLQRAVVLATHEAVVLMSRETLPPYVPIFAGSIFVADAESPRPPEMRTSIQWLIPDCAPPAALNLKPEPYDEERLERIRQGAIQLSRGIAFDVYSDLRREAMTQRRFGGNRRMAVVALAAAGEVFLDTVLLHMLWEEHTPPGEAAHRFDRHEGHTARVSRNFPVRLGGGWDPGASSPAGAYLRDLVRLRHQVVHAGHDPSPAELDAAWSTLFALEHYVGDRLAAEGNLNRYTRTAMAWMGERGLGRRGRFTRHVRDLIVDQREPLWMEAFARWRHHVDRALDPTPAPPGGRKADLMLYADLQTDGSLRWIIHDVSTAHAALVDPAHVRTDEEVGRAADLLARRASDEIADRRLGSLLDREPPQDLRWLPDHEVFPEFVLYPGTATAPPTP